MAKFYEQDELCVACGMSGCLRCTNSSICTLCDDTANWNADPDPDTQQCTCKKKFVEVGDLCESCPVGCNEC